MTCPKVGDLLRLVGGELPLDTARAVEAHAAECATCGSALAELRGGWDAVGEWQLLEAPYALPADALDRAGEPPVRRSLGPRLIRLRPAIRVAASLALAVGLGIGAGLLVPRGKTTTPAATAEPPAIEVVRRSLGISEIGGQSATGLSIGLAGSMASPAPDAEDA